MVTSQLTASHQENQPIFQVLLPTKILLARQKCVFSGVRRYDKHVPNEDDFCSEEKGQQTVQISHQSSFIQQDQTPSGVHQTVQVKQ